MDPKKTAAMLLAAASLGFGVGKISSLPATAVPPAKPAVLSGPMSCGPDAGTAPNCLRCPLHHC